MPKVVMAAPQALSDAQEPSQAPVAEEGFEGAEIATPPAPTPAFPPAGFEAPPPAPPAPEPSTFKPEPEPGIEPPAPVAASTAREFRFVKNINPIEKVILPDGQEIEFRRNLFTTRDPKVAVAIAEVAASYNIVSQ